MFIPSGPLSGLPGHKGAVNNLWLPLLGGSLEKLIALRSAGFLNPTRGGRLFLSVLDQVLDMVERGDRKKVTCYQPSSLKGGKVGLQETMETKLDKHRSSCWAPDSKWVRRGVRERLLGTRVTRKALSRRKVSRQGLEATCCRNRGPDISSRLNSGCATYLLCDCEEDTCPARPLLPPL